LEASDNNFGRSPRPSKDELKAAYGTTIPDVLSLNLQVLFCGINPGLYSGAVGHHFARPGNRFWRALHLSGFTDRVLAPFEDGELLRYGCGLTNLIERATATANELAPAELIEGGSRLIKKVDVYHPRVLAILGFGVYRTAFGQSRVNPGRQERMIGSTAVWVLPNPSGLNAHYQIDDFIELFQELHMTIL
jgi:TDG/mug DNA glycosylase family protein